MKVQRPFGLEFVDDEARLGAWRAVTNEHAWQRPGGRAEPDAHRGRGAPGARLATRRASLSPNNCKIAARNAGVSVAFGALLRTPRLRRYAGGTGAALDMAVVAQRPVQPYSRSQRPDRLVVAQLGVAVGASTPLKIVCAAESRAEVLDWPRGAQTSGRLVGSHAAGPLTGVSLRCSGPRWPSRFGPLMLWRNSLAAGPRFGVGRTGVARLVSLR